MNREIKFRAWDGERMFENIGLTPVEVIVYKQSNKMIPPEEDWSFGRDTVNIMQYTGLKDKSDNEIFEGDEIIHDTGEICTIVYCNGGFCMEYEDTVKKKIADYTMKYVKIIGNIYEPEKSQKFKDKKEIFRANKTIIIEKVKVNDINAEVFKDGEVIELPYTLEKGERIYVSKDNYINSCITWTEI